MVPGILLPHVVGIFEESTTQGQPGKDTEFTDFYLDPNGGLEPMYASWTEDVVFRRSSSSTII
jgi:hypothetical protein